MIPYLFTCSLFNNAVSNQGYVAAKDWVIMNWNEAVVILFKTLTLHVPAGTGEPERASVRLIVLERSKRVLLK